MPCDGFRPYTPLKWAGLRMDPPMSLPSSIGDMPMATAAAEPPEDPPVVRVTSHGLLVTP